MVYVILCFSLALQAQTSDVDLRAQVQQLLDEKAIQKVKTQYGRYIDDKDFEKFATVFTDTVTIDMRERGGQLLRLPNAAVVGFYQKQLADRSTQHFLTDMDIEWDGKAAKVRTNYYSIHVIADKRMDSTGWSYETYVKTKEGWKISELKLVPYLSPNRNE